MDEVRAEVAELAADRHADVGSLVLIELLKVVELLVVLVPQGPCWK